MSPLIIAGTGHRLAKLGYGDAVVVRLIALATACLKSLRPDQVISGMALGWDQALAQAAVNLKIPFIAAIPFDGQESRWPLKSQEEYRRLKGLAQEAVILCDGAFSPHKMQVRNEWMVDQSNLVLALWNGTSGGTANCVHYAEKKGVPIKNAWSSWIKYK